MAGEDGLHLLRGPRYDAGEWSQRLGELVGGGGLVGAGHEPHEDGLEPGLMKDSIEDRDRQYEALE